MDLLLIEDDPVLGKSLQKGLREAGYDCAWATDGERGWESAQSHQFDCILLDMMLPKCPGLDLLRELRAAGQRTPVIALTALGSVDQRVNGLQAGADDYLVKPFEFAELVARIEAVCRRSGVRPSARLHCGELSLDLSTRRVRLGRRDIDLTPTEFSVLEFLMRHAGHVVSRKMLCEHLWESDWEGVTNVIEVHINRLRGKLDRDLNREKGKDRSVIQTVRGRGYALRAE